MSVSSEGGPARDALGAIARRASARLAAVGPGPSLDRLAALLEEGRALAALGDRAASEPLLQAADLAESLGERGARRGALAALGAVRGAHGDEVGRAHLERILVEAQRVPDESAASDAAFAAAELARIRALAGDRDGAAAALQLARDESNRAPALRARVAARGADVARLLGDLDGARAGYLQARAALPSGDALERAALELVLEEGLGALESASARPATRELASLSAEDGFRVLDAALALAVATPAARAALAAETIRRLAGSPGVALRAGDRLLAASGDLAGPTSEVRAGTIVVAIAEPADRKLTSRDAIVARALAAFVAAAPVETTSAAERVLGLVDRVLGAGLDLERLVVVATDLAVEATGAARGFILIREPGAKLGFRGARRKGRADERGAGSDVSDPAGVVSRSLVREVLLTGRALLLADAARDPRLADNESVGGRGLRSVLVAPIPDEETGRAMGALYLDDPGQAGRFGAVEREVAIGFAARLGGPLRSVLEREKERAAAATARVAAGHPGTRPATKHDFSEIRGHGRAIGAVLELLDRAADASAPVLVSGESGTGKELVARSLHRSGARAAGPFQAVSCAAIADSVLESELFGHVAGSFTGAKGARKGMFELAHKGTLFLDELQEASPKLQAELLRVLETGEVRPVGADAVRRVDVRLVAATNADLAALVASGDFREDLYHRVNVIHVRLPALRERIEDLPELAVHLLERAGRPREDLTEEALERLLADAWPGNVRALRNCIERALVHAGRAPIRAEHIVLEPGPARPVAPRARDLHAAAIELNERQLAAIEILRSEPEIGNAEFAARTGVSQPTGWRDLSDLVAKGVLIASGKARRTTYRLAPGWEARVRGE